MTPWTVLQAAVKAVPALKYALGVLGIASAIAIIKGFGIDFRVAVFGTIIMVVLMTALVVFASLTKVQSPQVRLAALALMWSFLTLTILSALLLFTSTFFEYPKPLTQLFGGVQVGTSAPGETNSKPIHEPKLLMTMMEMIRDEEGSRVLHGAYPSGTNLAVGAAARDVCDYLNRVCYLDDPGGTVRIHFPADLGAEKVSVTYEPPDRPYKLYYWILGQLEERRHFTFDPENQDAFHRLAKKSHTIFWRAERPGYVGNTRETPVGVKQTVVVPLRRSSVNIAVVDEEDKDTEQAELLRKAISDCSPPIEPQDSRPHPRSPRFVCFGKEKLDNLKDLYKRQQADIKAALINEGSLDYKVKISHEK